MKEESDVLLLLLEMEWVKCKEQSQGAKCDPWPMVKKRGPQSYKNEMNSASSMNDLESGLFPREYR